MPLDDLGKLFKIGQNVAEEQVTSQATYYPYHVRVYTPNVPIKKIRNGFERIKDREDILEEMEKKTLFQYETSEERSIRRSKQAIRDYVLCNKFEYFVTLTFKEYRYDLDRCRKRILNWLKNQRKRTGKFEYIVIIELHKDEAYHFHALIKNYKGELKPAVNAKTGKIIPNVFNFKSYTHGHSTVKKIRESELDRIKTGNYLIKYMTKEMPMFPGKKRYWSSNNLKVPYVEDNPSEWYANLTPLREYISDYGTIREYMLPENMRGMYD